MSAATRARTPLGSRSVIAQRIRRGRRAGLLGDVDALLLAAIRSLTLIGLSTTPPWPQTLAWRVPAPQAVSSSQA